MPFRLSGEGEAGPPALRALTWQTHEVVASGETGEARDLRDRMWEGVYETFKQVYDLSDIWNDVAPRVPAPEAE